MCIFPDRRREKLVYTFKESPCRRPETPSLRFPIHGSFSLPLSGKHSHCGEKRPFQLLQFFPSSPKRPTTCIKNYILMCYRRWLLACFDGWASEQLAPHYQPISLG